MATQEQDFNKESNRQFTRLFIKDSQGITIDLTEVQCAQVLQILLMLPDLERRLKPSATRGETISKHLERLVSPADGEMQDSELNSLLQGQSIYIENCADVRISVRQLEVQKVVEFGPGGVGPPRAPTQR
jgi:Spore Coat Protein X and V domain